MQITIQTIVNAPIDAAWHAWNTPADIMAWNTASDDWHTPSSEVDLRVGGKFNNRMEAKDGSFGFDMTGTYTAIEEQKLIEFTMDDDRTVRITFEQTDEGVKVSETFEAEDTHTAEQQRAGWQAILDNFKKHVEGKA